MPIQPYARLLPALVCVLCLLTGERALFAQADNPGATKEFPVVFLLRPVIPWNVRIGWRISEPSFRVGKDLQIDGMGLLLIRSTPAGARVLLGGKTVGTTPLWLVTQTGELRFTLYKEGFVSWNTSLPLSARTITLSARLAPLPSATPPPIARANPPAPPSAREKPAPPTMPRAVPERPVARTMPAQPVNPPSGRDVQKQPPRQARVCPSKRFESCMAQKACEGGDAYGCAMVGVLIMQRAQRKDEKKGALNTLAKACAMKSGLGCAYLGRFFDEGIVGKRQRKRAQRLYQMACRLSSGEGCRRLSRFVGRRLRHVKQRLRMRSRANFARDCRRDRAFACERLAQIDARKRGKRAWIRSLYKKACDLGRRTSCNRLAASYAYARRKYRHPKRAHRYWLRACRLGSSIGCEQVGRLHHRGKGAPKDPLRAVFFYNQGRDRAKHRALRLLYRTCRKKKADQSRICTTLAQLHCQGDNPASQATENAACQRGYMAMCALFCHPKHIKYVRVYRRYRRKKRFTMSVTTIPDRKPPRGAIPLSASRIRRYIARQRRKVQYCYERELKRDPELQGKIALRIVILPSGKASHISVEENTLNARAARCILRRFRFMRFPKPPQTISLVVPFLFSAQP